MLVQHLIGIGLKVMEKHPRVLLLNISYAPIGVLNWQKAVNLVLFRNKAHVCAEYKNHPSKKFSAAVIRLTVKTPNPYSMIRLLRYSKRNVFMRDQLCCQYCNRRFFAAELTIDHIVPRSRGGTTDYLNCVACCKPCNSKKDNRTPSEASMQLMGPPRVPALSELLGLGSVPDEWKDWMPQANIWPK